MFVPNSRYAGSKSKDPESHPYLITLMQQSQAPIAPAILISIPVVKIEESPCVQATAYVVRPDAVPTTEPTDLLSLVGVGKRRDCAGLLAKALRAKTERRM